jgi:hypothetical protein
VWIGHEMAGTDRRLLGVIPTRAEAAKTSVFEPKKLRMDVAGGSHFFTPHNAAATGTAL